MDMRCDEGEDVGGVACAEDIHLSAQLAPRLAVGPVERHCLDRHELGTAGHAIVSSVAVGMAIGSAIVRSDEDAPVRAATNLA